MSRAPILHVLFDLQAIFVWFFGRVQKIARRPKPSSPLKKRPTKQTRIHSV